MFTFVGDNFHRVRLYCSMWELGKHQVGCVCRKCTESVPKNNILDVTRSPGLQSSTIKLPDKCRIITVLRCIITTAETALGQTQHFIMCSAHTASQPSYYGLRRSRSYMSETRCFRQQLVSTIPWTKTFLLNRQQIQTQ